MQLHTFVAGQPDVLTSCLVQTSKYETKQSCPQMRQLEAQNGQLLAGIGQLQIHYSVVVCQMSQLQQQLQVQQRGNTQLLTLIGRLRRAHPVSAEAMIWVRPMLLVWIAVDRHGPRSECWPLGAVRLHVAQEQAFGSGQVRTS